MFGAHLFLLPASLVGFSFQPPAHPATLAHTCRRGRTMRVYGTLPWKFRPQEVSSKKNGQSENCGHLFSLSLSLPAVFHMLRRSCLHPTHRGPPHTHFWAGARSIPGRTVSGCGGVTCTCPRGMYPRTTRAGALIEHAAGYFITSSERIWDFRAKIISPVRELTHESLAS